MPEIQNVAILDLADVAEGRHELLHKDQLSLFQAVQRHFREAAAPTTRPIRSSLAKIGKLLDSFVTEYGEAFYPGERNSEKNYRLIESAYRFSLSGLGF